MKSEFSLTTEENSNNLIKFAGASEFYEITVMLYIDIWHINVVAVIR